MKLEDIDTNTFSQMTIEQQKQVLDAMQQHDLFILASGFLIFSFIITVIYLVLRDDEMTC